MLANNSHNKSDISTTKSDPDSAKNLICSAWDLLTLCGRELGIGPRIRGAALEYQILSTLLFKEKRTLHIKRDIETKSGRVVSEIDLYPALLRLEAESFIQGRYGEPEAARGGRSARFYRLTGKGRDEQNRIRLSEGEEVVLGNLRPA